MNVARPGVRRDRAEPRKTLPRRCRTGRTLGSEKNSIVKFVSACCSASRRSCAASSVEPRRSRPGSSGGRSPRCRRPRSFGVTPSRRGRCRARRSSGSSWRGWGCWRAGRSSSRDHAGPAVEGDQVSGARPVPPTVFRWASAWTADAVQALPTPASRRVRADEVALAPRCRPSPCDRVAGERLPPAMLMPARPLPRCAPPLDVPPIVLFETALEQDSFLRLRSPMAPVPAALRPTKFPWITAPVGPIVGIPDADARAVVPRGRRCERSPRSRRS